MTVRNTATTAAAPEEVAALIEPHTVWGVLHGQSYRKYTDQLEELVGEITGVSDRGFTLEVARELGTGASDWYRHRLSRMIEE